MNGDGNPGGDEAAPDRPKSGGDDIQRGRENAATVRTAMGGFDQVFGMRHHAKHIARVVQHARENRVRYPARSYRPVMAASLAALVALPCFAAAERGRDGIESLAWGTESFALFENRFSVSGAGVGGHDVHRTIFNPHWRVLRPVVVKGNRRL